MSVATTEQSCCTNGEARRLGRRRYAADRDRPAFGARGENPYKARAYSRAAQNLLTLTLPLGEVIAAYRLREIPGVGEALAATIEQLYARGTTPKRTARPCVSGGPGDAPYSDGSAFASATPPSLTGTRQTNAPPSAVFALGAQAPAWRLERSLSRRAA